MWYNTGMKSGGTIVALSSAAGRGAVSVVRMSGPNAVALLGACFSRAERLEHGRMVLGTFDAGRVRDRVFAVAFYAPDSYTGEDVCEVHCHGSPEIVSAVIARLTELGARPAEPGEFTRRAFEAGKMSLDEAEAVGDLINAQSAAAIAAAYDGMRGALHKAVSGIYSALLDLAAEMTAALDYPEEDVEARTAAEALPTVRRARKDLKDLIDSYGAGEKIRGGVRVAIVGVPNAGKSSLLNSLLGRDRAIVTAKAGTTRDTIEESYEYKGVLFTLVDTAGVRETTDEAEAAGVARSAEAAKTAHIVLRVIDLSAPVVLPVETRGVVIDVYNKTDIADGGGETRVSALTGRGVKELKERIYSAAMSGGVSPGGAMLTNSRHYALALEADEELAHAETALETDAIDLASAAVSGALAALGGITGANATEDVLDGIFSRFCVGK